MSDAKIKTYEDLIVWQEGYKLVLEVYRMTEGFPQHERFGVTSQIRRAAVSFTANIVEGQVKGSTKDFLRFLHIARGSLRETSFFLKLSRDLTYLSDEDYAKLNDICARAGYLLHRLIQSLRKD